ncbi:LysR substrate-binding domain-containing protein [Methylobacterium oryzihabitans]|uniref:LysR family transcriptional regulator n=1 Tax=Methylobacterium oryzihabitans TaxID=2499852 RepID=A0A437NXM7_9HYPH|nr:LysR substrate-binding domain-containing protein [Methylobacterium oryzihabitans]RVU14765.1 LysR family transcriptional regulator [Methylobacterium oryzihabitans]
MPTTHLPLNALRAFEVAARLGSMNAAAVELGVTPGAISRHVKTLEDRFGLPLFERHPRAIVPTREGAQLASELAEVFERMQIAVSRVQPGPLTLSCSSTVMMRWLIPRLKNFKKSHGSIDLRLNVSYDDIDFIRDEISIAIRTSIYRAPTGATAERLIREEIGPVCHPEYANRLDFSQPEDTARARILGSATRPQAWSDWALATGRPDLRITQNEVYEHFYLVIQAAACGLGLALAPRFLVEDEIRSGHLVAPIGFVAGPYEMQLWIADHLRGRVDVKATADWIRTEMCAGPA